MQKLHEKKDIYTLGVSFGYHDSSAALVKNGKVIAAIQEERLSRIKNTSAFPAESIKFCLNFAGINPARLDAVYYYENASKKFDRIVKLSLINFPSSFSYFKNVFQKWIYQKKFTPTHAIRNFLRPYKCEIKSIDHHLSHSSSAFYCSDYDEAIAITIDGVGEFETLTISHCNGNSLTKLTSSKLPHSLGLFYSAFTSFLGFKVNEDEYKVMGMSGYGSPQYVNEFFNLFSFNNYGSFTLDQKYFNFVTPKSFLYNDNLIKLLGPPREFNSTFSPYKACDMHYANIAASVQRCTEMVVSEIVNRARNDFKKLPICFAGGVALNGLANKHVRQTITEDLYVNPASGDSGTSIGAALYAYYSKYPNSQKTPLSNAYLGPANDSKNIEYALKRYKYFKVQKFNQTDELILKIATLLSDGKIIGWVQGRSEFGPRALGARSILANPLIDGMQDKVNAKIKFRESFRPFAPAVTIEQASNFFEIDKIKSQTDPQYFMLTVCKVKEKYKKIMPSITHTDGTARVQIVSEESSNIFYKLLIAFGEINKYPVLLNTSFNLRGEPIVENVEDALKTFDWCNLDYLCIGNFIVKKD